MRSKWMILSFEELFEYNFEWSDCYLLAVFKFFAIIFHTIKDSAIHLIILFSHENYKLMS